MPKRDVDILIQDILAAIGKIDRYVLPVAAEPDRRVPPAYSMTSTQAGLASRKACVQSRIETPSTTCV